MNSFSNPVPVSDGFAKSTSADSPPNRNAEQSKALNWRFGSNSRRAADPIPSGAHLLCIL